MPAIVDLPTLVQAALAVFGALLDTDPARRHFAEALTGLRVAETKTVRGSKREIVVTTDQSCLPRGLTEARWDVKARNDRRLEWRPRDPRTRYSPRGVIAMEQTLVEHAGKLIADVGWRWAHVAPRHVLAHDSLMSNSVGPSAKHAPIAWRRFNKREACQGGCKDHTALCLAWIDDAMIRAIPGDFTFDC